MARSEVVTRARRGAPPDYEAIGRAVWHHVRTRAITAVSAAMEKGQLPRFDPETPTPCADCGRDAAIYEHRDYMRPLDVVPACVPCNSQRGAAAFNVKAWLSIVGVAVAELGEEPNLRFGNYWINDLASGVVRDTDYRDEDGAERAFRRVVLRQDA